MIPPYKEKCLKKPYYFLLDDFYLDNKETSAFFYIPGKERPNWYDYSILIKKKMLKHILIKFFF